MECPYCKCSDEIAVPYVPLRNAEIYGSNQFQYPCPNCKKMIKVVIKREVRIIEITKSNLDRSQSDFCDEQLFSKD